MKDEIKSKITERFTQAEIGRRMGVSQQTVFKWLKKQVPDKRVIPLCELLGWEILPQDIRPDLHPTPISGIPDGVTLPPSTEGGLNNGDQA